LITGLVHARTWTFVGSEDSGPWAARLCGLRGTCRFRRITPLSAAVVTWA